MCWASQRNRGTAANNYSNWVKGHWNERSGWKARETDNAAGWVDKCQILKKSSKQRNGNNPTY
jgi:hypothetical protein